MEEKRKVFVSEREGNTPALSGEVIMESVGSPQEEVKLNNDTSLDACKVPHTLEVG